MNEYIKLAIAQIPIYFMDLMQVTFSPVDFVVTRVRPDDETMLSKAFVFLGLTTLMTALLMSFFLRERGDLLFLFAIYAIINGLLYVLLAASLRFSWKLVGGRARLREVFVATVFLMGPPSLISAIAGLIGEAAYKIISPENFDKRFSLSLEALPEGVWFSSPGEAVSSVILVLGLFVTLVWSTCAWGAYRRLNAIPSRFRSFLALVIASLLSIPLLFIAFSMVFPLIVALQ